MHTTNSSGKPHDDEPNVDKSAIHGRVKRIRTTMEKHRGCGREFVWEKSRGEGHG